MDYTSFFSELSSRMKSSKIRELMKYASMPGIISFGGGMPDPSNFPVDAVKSIIHAWDSSKAQGAMQYGRTEGYGPLLDSLRARMRDKKKIRVDDQELIITSGAQQGLFMMSRIFINPGDTVLVEEPTFIGAMSAMISARAKLVGLPLEADGVNLDLLEAKLKELHAQGVKPKFFYTIPNFQNPGGTALSVEKRKRLYDLSAKYQLLIIEDDPYGDLFFDGGEEDYLPLKSLGNEAPIIYLGSFSKILSPGFRLGWVLGDAPFIEKIALFKQSLDACSSSFGQVVANDYLDLNIIETYLVKMREVYRLKRDCMVNAIKSYFPEEAQSSYPKGGFFIYVRLPAGVSSEALFKKTIERKVAFVTGEPFHTDPRQGDQHMRLAFSNSTEAEIEQGIRIIGESLKEMFR